MNSINGFSVFSPGDYVLEIYRIYYFIRKLIAAIYTLKHVISNLRNNANCEID